MSDIPLLADVQPVDVVRDIGSVRILDPGESTFLAVRNYVGDLPTRVYADLDKASEETDTFVKDFLRSGWLVEVAEGTIGIITRHDCDRAREPVARLDPGRYEVLVSPGGRGRDLQLPRHLLRRVGAVHQGVPKEDEWKRLRVSPGLSVLDSPRLFANLSVHRLAEESEDDEVPLFFGPPGVGEWE